MNLRKETSLLKVEYELHALFNVCRKSEQVNNRVCFFNYLGS